MIKPIEYLRNLIVYLYGNYFSTGHLARNFPLLRIFLNYYPKMIFSLTCLDKTRQTELYVFYIFML